MSATVTWILAAGVLPMVGYFVGSVPFGYVAGRVNGLDIRTRGSGNVGATNVFRVLGRGWGLSVFAMDVVKGLAPTLAAGVVLAHQGTIRGAALYGLWLLTAFAAIAGHVWPCWLRFKGGKGVATSLGVVLGVWPHYTLAGLIALAVWVLVTRISRYVSLGSICAAVVFPLAMVAMGVVRTGGVAWLRDAWPLLAFSVLVPVLIVWRHRGNIVRLLHGQEKKIGQRA